LVIRHRDSRENVIKKMKEKYFDVVSSEFFNYPSAEEILKKLNIEKIYVVKEINKREDLDFVFPKAKNTKPAFLFKDLNLYSNLKNKITKNALILGQGSSLSANTNIISSKSEIHLLNPISSETAFDEGLARIAKQNKKIIFFDIREIRYNQNKAIKQTLFILELLKKRNVEFRFVSMAKVPEDLVDPIVLKNFLRNLGIERAMIKRILEDL
jgi:hypothetical protein